MKDREFDSIYIKRNVGGVETTLLKAPITPSSVRRFKLMETNEITLEFSSDIAKPIEVGDYVDDELFGRFYSKEPQVSVYNKITGGYDYSLKFVSHEMMWSNYKFLMSNIKNDGSYGRKETSWKLTAPLQGHLTQVRQNLVALGLYNDVLVCMSDTIEKSNESKFISYDGDSIHSGLKKICDTFECEWWTTFAVQGLQVERLSQVIEDEGHVGDYDRDPSYDRLISEDFGEFHRAIKLKAYRNKDNDVIYISDTNALYYIYEEQGGLVIRKRTDRITPPIIKTYTPTGKTKTSVKIPSTTKYEYMNEEGEYLYSDKVLTPESKYYTFVSGGWEKFNIVNPTLVSKSENTRNVDENATLCLFVGKCENWEGVEMTSLEGSVSTWHPMDTTPMDFIEGDNVESMSIAKDQSEYANRIYVFGGTQNMPSSYRKQLKLKVTKASEYTIKGVQRTYFEDVEHEIKSHMVSLKSATPEKTATLGTTKHIQQSKYVYPNTTLVDTFTLNRSYQVTLKYSFDVNVKAVLMDRYRSQEVRADYMRYCCSTRLFLTKEGDSDFEVLLDESKNYTFSQNYVTQDIDGHVTFQSEGKELMLEEGVYKVNLTLGAPTFDSYYGQTEFSIRDSWGNIYARQGMDVFNASENDYYMLVTLFGCNNTNKNSLVASYDSGESYLLNILYNGQKYLIMYNPEEQSTTTLQAKQFAFVSVHGKSIEYENIPSGFGVGSVFEPLIESITTDEDYPYGMKVMEIPMGWYSGDYDNPFSLLTIGETRLCLPMEVYPNGYMGEELQPHALVEKVVCFDEVYPRCVLMVTKVTTMDKKMKTEYEDGSIMKTSYSEYHIEVENIGGGEFPFQETYQSQGTLKMNFVNLSVLTEVEKSTMPPNAKVSKLAGMQFECNFGRYNNSNKGFLIIINDNYGANLPNETLHPEEGDICVLTNWDVRAMLHLGLVENAENQLKMKGEEYKSALRENQYTFTCQMMSGEMLRRAFYESMGKRMVEGEHIYLKGDGGSYYLPQEGQKVRVKSETLKEGERVSRVLGYEFKLDIPYDTPTYTIGETDAYSRLKKIEKEITKLS